MAIHFGGRESALRKLGVIFGVDRLFLLLVSEGDDMMIDYRVLGRGLSGHGDEPSTVV